MAETGTHQSYFSNRELDALPVGQKLFTNGTPTTKMTHRTWATDTLGISYPQSKLCFTHADNPHVVVPEQTKETAAMPETDSIDTKLLVVVEEHFDQGPVAVAEAIKRELRVSFPFTRPLRDAPEPAWPTIGDIWASKSYRDGEPVRVTELSESEQSLGMKFVRCALVGDISAVGNLIPLSFFNKEFTFVAAEPIQPSVGEIWAQKSNGEKCRVIAIEEGSPNAQRGPVVVRQRLVEPPDQEQEGTVDHWWDTRTYLVFWTEYFGFISAS